MTIISTREFRDNQKAYFERVDKGEQIIIQRGKDRSYKLVPVKDEDVLMSEKEYFEMLDRSIEQIEKGKFTTLEPDADIHKFIQNLCTE